MAFKKAKVARKPELENVVSKLKEKYSVAYEDIQPGRIFYLENDGKSRKVIKLQALKLPHPDMCQFRFALTVYSQLWDDLDEARQVMYIHRELLRIVDFEEGKMSRYPVQDFPEIVEKYGVLWEENEDLPNILEEEDKEENEESDEEEVEEDEEEDDSNDDDDVLEM